MRKMVAIKEIIQISPIDNADKLELATVDGWEVVVPKGKHHKGQKVAYFEIDTVLPKSNPLFDDFTSKSSKSSVNPQGNIIKGHVLKTIKLRGQISQGLVMSLDEIGLSSESSQEDVDNWMDNNGVFKHNPPASIASGSTIVGSFPSNYARKTDSERVQNLGDDFLDFLDKEEWFATEKVDGTSATFFCDDDGVFRAASRNNEISLEGDSPWVKAARKFDLASLMSPGQVIQAEVYGEGIQKNPLKITGVDIAVFHTKNITEDDGAVYNLIQDKKAPVVDLVLPSTVKEAVDQVYGMKSVINPKVLAEGVVWWNRNGTAFSQCGNRPNFKVINNKFLLKNG